jgi:hypothetical protein
MSSENLPPATDATIVSQSKNEVSEAPVRDIVMERYRERARNSLQTRLRESVERMSREWGWDTEELPKEDSKTALPHLLESPTEEAESPDDTNVARSVTISSMRKG